MSFIETNIYLITVGMWCSNMGNVITVFKPCEYVAQTHDYTNVDNFTPNKNLRLSFSVSSYANYLECIIVLSDILIGNLRIYCWNHVLREPSCLALSSSVVLSNLSAHVGPRHWSSAVYSWKDASQNWIPLTVSLSVYLQSLDDTGFYDTCFMYSSTGLEADFPFGLNRVVTNVDKTRGLILSNREGSTYTYATRENTPHIQRTWQSSCGKGYPHYNISGVIWSKLYIGEEHPLL